MKWIEVKMRELGVSNNPNYKICFFLDSLAMITVHTQKYGTVNVSMPLLMNMLSSLILLVL